ncbi:MAG: hypothetical protein WBX15_05400, partial [Thermoanaerobaculia bacterium]
MKIDRQARRRLFVSTALLFLVSVPLVMADGFPPYWDNSTGAVHYAPIAWPADAQWVPYTSLATDIDDPRVNDPSNGGTSPQNYVNASSGCTDETLPSIYWFYDPVNKVIFFRWRVEQRANTYATGPSAGSFSASDPWNSAQWTVMFDVNGDGYRDFAVHLDGSSGGPGKEVDRLVSVWSDELTQSIDYYGDPDIHQLFHNPTAFVDKATSEILNFQNSVTPVASWPNGSAETVWDYGTTRATKIPAGCTEFFIDYQIPLAMLDATAVGGPKLTENTPFSFIFATANSLQNPFQKDVVVNGNFVCDITNPAPFGDSMTLTGGIVQQPTVLSVTASGCPANLTARVQDAILSNNCVGSSTVTNVDFFAYPDTNADGQPDDAGSWSLIASGTPSTTVVGLWSATWNSLTAEQGQYLIGVRATDNQGNSTFSYYTQAEVNADVGTTPPNYPNLTPTPGLLWATIYNSCGVPPPSASKAASPSTVTAGSTVTFTVTVTNPTSSAITLSSIDDALPSGFTYAATTGGSLTPTGSPAGGSSGTIQWTFSPSATIAAGSSGTLTFTAQAPATTGTYANTATASTSAGSLPTPPATVVVGAPRLSIAKSASANLVAPGATVTYTLTYSNDSPVNATGAEITDTLPAELTFVSSPTGSYDAPSRTITWNVGDLGAGEGPFTVQFTATVASPYPAASSIQLANTATIDSNETAPSSAISTILVDAPRPAFTIQKSASAPLVSPGSNATFTINYQNTGNSTATNVAITDAVPAGFTFVSATGGGTLAGSTVTWNLGSIAAGASGSVTVTVAASSPFTGTDPTVNTATLTSAETSPVSDSYTIGIIATTCSSNTTWNFHATTTDVGTGGTQKIANTTAPTAATASIAGPFTVGSASVEIARFYGDPVSTGVSVSGTATVSVYIDKSGSPQANVTAFLYDYDPAGGALVLLGSGTSAAITGNRTNQLNTISVPVSGALPTGHRFLFIISATTNHVSQTNDISLEFDGTSSPSSFVFCQLPLLPVLDKQVSALSAQAGDTLTYSIHFGNAGAGNLTGATVVDTLPAGVTFVSATLNGSGVSPTAISGQQYTFAVNTSDTATAGQLTSAQNGSLVITATVDSPLAPAVLSLVNNVSLTSTGPTRTDSTTTAVVRPNVTISKSASATQLEPGSTMSYTLTLLNSGSGSASNVTVTDALPTTAYFTYVSATPSSGSCSEAAGTVTCTIPALAAKATATVTINMQVAASGVPDGVTYLDNSATVSDAATAGTRGSNTVTVAIATYPVLEITKSASVPSPLGPGDQITYTIDLSNTGSGAATSVVVDDSIPTNTSYVPGSLTFDSASQTDIADGDSAWFDGTAVHFSVASLAGGAAHALTFKVTVDSPLPNGSTVIGNTATVSAANAAPKSASTSSTATAAESLSLSKSAPSVLADPLATVTSVTSPTVLDVDSTTNLGVNQVIAINGTAATITAISGTQLTLGSAVTAAAGDTLVPTFEYTIQYANSGDATAQNVTVTDPLPSGLLYVSSSPAPSAAPAIGANGTVSWNIGDVPPGSAAVLHIRVQPSATGSYTNTATLSSTTTPSVIATATTTVGSLEPSKEALIASVTNSGSGATTQYRITITNQLPTTVSGVTVTDTLSSGFTYASTDATGGTASRTSTSDPTAGSVQPVWGTWDIPGNGTLTIDFTANVDASVGAGTYQNDVSATAPGAPSLSFDFLGTTADDVTVSLNALTADLSLTKTVDNASPNVADNVTFTITLTNGGPDDATNVAVKDQLPAGLTFVSSTPSTGSYSNATGIWTVGTVANGAAPTLQVVAAVTTAGAKMNTAEVSASDQADPDSTPNNGSAAE